MSGVWFYLLLLAFSGAGIVFILMGIPPLGLLFLAWPVTWLGLTLIDLTMVQPGLAWVTRLATQYPLASVLDVHFINPAPVVFRLDNARNGGHARPTSRLISPFHQ
jgi:hypothetical protein